MRCWADICCRAWIHLKANDRDHHQRERRTLKWQRVSASFRLLWKYIYKTTTSFRHIYWPSLFQSVIHVVKGLRDLRRSKSLFLSLRKGDKNIMMSISEHECHLEDIMMVKQKREIYNIHIYTTHTQPESLLNFNSDSRNAFDVIQSACAPGRFPYKAEEMRMQTMSKSQLFLSNKINIL